MNVIHMIAAIRSIKFSFIFSAFLTQCNVYFSQKGKHKYDLKINIISAVDISGWKCAIDVQKCALEC